MKNLIVSIGILFLVSSALANPGEYLQCANTDWNLDIGVSSVDPSQDMIYIAIANKEGFERTYSTPVKKGSVRKALADGLALNVHGADDANLTVKKNRASLVLAAQTLSLSCVPAKP